MQCVIKFCWVCLLYKRIAFDFLYFSLTPTRRAEGQQEEETQRQQQQDQKTWSWSRYLQGELRMEIIVNTKQEERIHFPSHCVMVLQCVPARHVWTHGKLSPPPRVWPRHNTTVEAAGGAVAVVSRAAAISFLLEPSWVGNCVRGGSWWSSTLHHKIQKQ